MMGKLMTLLMLTSILALVTCEWEGQGKWKALQKSPFSPKPNEKMATHAPHHSPHQRPEAKRKPSQHKSLSHRPPEKPKVNAKPSLHHMKIKKEWGVPSGKRTHTHGHSHGHHGYNIIQLDVGKKRVTDTCGNAEYIPRTQICCGNKILHRKGIRPFCCGNEVHDYVFGICCNGKYQPRTVDRPIC